MNLLHQREALRGQRRLMLYAETRARLRDALEELLPGTEVLLFGSITKAGRFNDNSDVDIAMEDPPQGMTEWALAADLEDRVGRPIDLVLLGNTEPRLARTIREGGERWTISG